MKHDDFILNEMYTHGQIESLTEEDYTVTNLVDPDDCGEFNQIGKDVIIAESNVTESILTFILYAANATDYFYKLIYKF